MKQPSCYEFMTIPCSLSWSAGSPIPNIVALQVLIEEIVEALIDTG